MISTKKIMILVTGPIGVGKSTLIKALYNQMKLLGFEFVSADLYYYLYFMNSSDSENLNYKKAKQYCKYKMDKIRHNQASLLWETVVAKESKIDILINFKQEGYSIYTIMLNLQDSDVLSKRVLRRHLEGWYNIPDVKIKSRMKEVINYSIKLREISDIYIDINSSILSKVE